MTDYQSGPTVPRLPDSSPQTNPGLYTNMSANPDPLHVKGGAGVGTALIVVMVFLVIAVLWVAIDMNRPATEAAPGTVQDTAPVAGEPAAPVLNDTATVPQTAEPGPVPTDPPTVPAAPADSN
jgi:hypothetical protein